MVNSAAGQPSEFDRSDEPGKAGQRRLWTPWRMQYVGGATTEPGCIFCNRLAAAHDVRSLILYRGTQAFVIMNLFPYNTGHTMIVPNEHTPSPEDANPDCVTEMSQLRRPLLRALRRTLGCHGFNLGINVGSEAGAGIAGHLHEHVVPRWTGDANFMPILANTTVMPELIPITYAKLRAELIREQTGAAEVRCVVLGQDDTVLVDATGVVPSLAIIEPEPVWKWAASKLSALAGTDLHLTGWCGDPGAGGSSIGLSFRTGQTTSEPATAPGWRWIAPAEATTGSVGELVANALANQLG